MKKKGFTLIELLAVIVILAIIALIAMPLILNVIDEAKKGAFKNTAYGIVEAGQLVYAKDMLQGIEGEVTFTYVDGVETASVDGKKLDYKGTKPKNGTITLNSEGKIAIAIHDGKYCAEKGYEESVITLSTKSIEECVGDIEITYSDYDVIKGVNAPKLTTGMTPIKWNGTDWVSTNENDIDWYNYDENKWANVKTADGSFWVWIPRYAYSIASGYHTSTEGTINIKFLIDKTNGSSDGTMISTTPTYSGDSQTNYVLHPAFTFGTDEITGIWVAKFEPSVSDIDDDCYTNPSTLNCNNNTLTPKIVPNVSSWRNISIKNAYEVSRIMETNPIYGWGSSGDNIDTHLMKNIEWGVVAYLSKSNKGQNENEIRINNSRDYITGCAATNQPTEIYPNYLEYVFGCDNTYESVIGQLASTTGNIYGIYDLTGGARERVMGNYDNYGEGGGWTNEEVAAIPNKYIDRYSGSNYGFNSNTFGDAVYETREGSVWDGSVWIGDISNSWFGDYSYFPHMTAPWFARGGSYSYGTGTGSFSSHHTFGGGQSIDSFRPVLIVGEGL
jgi:prepilin-type N-terminal cleavage/methylation domain-containing protein